MRKIRLTERQLVQFIEKSVNKLLKEQSNDVQVYLYPNDTRWVYSVQNQKWFASKNVEPYNWININDNPKYERSIQKLDKQFPNARDHQQVAGIPLTNTGKTPKYDFDSETKIASELPTPGYKDPNRFNSNADKPTKVPFRR